jgi:hypothetical protein
MKKLTLTLILLALGCQIFAQADSVLIINQNFETDFQDAVNQADWVLSTTSAISGTKSMKHNLTNKAGSSYISFPFSAGNIANGKFTWRFKLKNGNWAPSSTNKFQFYLTSTDSKVLSTTNNGYAIGVQLGTKDNLISLCKIKNGAVSKTLLATSFTWKASSLVGIEVNKDENGNWTVKIDNNGNFDNLQLQGTANDNELSAASYCGLAFTYTSTRAGGLWFDDLQVWAPKPNDLTSQVLPSNMAQPEFLNSNNDNESSKMTVFGFILKDMASGDKLPTKINGLTIKAGSNNQLPDWTKIVGGVLLTLKTGNDSISITGTVLSNEVKFSSLPEIADGTEKLAIVKIWLAHDLSTITDLNQLGFLINEKCLSVDNSGSGFTSGTVNSEASKLKIDIIASQLVCENFQNPIISKPFSISVKAVDKNGNTDLAEREIKINKQSGANIISHSFPKLSGKTVKGQFKIPDCVAESTGQYDFQVISDGLPNLNFKLNISEALDANSTLEMLPPTDVSTNISSLICQPGNAKEIFKLKISDLGTEDGKPTRVKQIVLLNTKPANKADWTNNIRGLSIWKDNQLLPCKITVADDSITLNFKPDSLIIPDKSLIEISVGLYFNENGKITDNKTFQFSLSPKSNMVYGASSAFAPNQSGSSTIFTAEVIARYIAFSSQPTKVGVNQAFTAKVAALDEYGNVDTDYSADGQIMMTLGNGSLAHEANLQFTLSKGLATLSNLTYSGFGYFILTPKCEKLSSLQSNPIFSSDYTSSIQQVNFQGTSSISSLNNCSGNAVDILKIKISDAGTADKLPTIITRLTLKNVSGNNSANWHKSIGGIYLKGNMNVYPSKIEIYPDEIQLTLPDTALVIPDGTTQEYVVSLYLDKHNVQDNCTLQFYIEANNHGWQTATISSSFAPAQAFDILSNPLKTEVKATEIRTLNAPSLVRPNQKFEVNVLATDANGNIDMDYSGKALVNQMTGESTVMAEPLEISLTNGIGKTTCWCQQTGDYLLSVSSKASNLKTSETIKISSSDKIQTIVNHKFDNENLINWFNTDDWAISSVPAIEESLSLKHNAVAKSSSEIFRNFQAFWINDKVLSWEFLLQKGNFDFTSSSYITVYLAADAQNSASLNGYALCFGKSSYRSLEFWKVVNGKNSVLLAKDTFGLVPFTPARLRISRDNTGSWQISGNEFNDSLQTRTILKANDPENLLVSNFGLNFHFSSTSAGQLWLDNLKINSTAVAIRLQKAVSISNQKILLQFTSKMQKAEMENAANYVLKNTKGETIPIISSTLNPENETQVFINVNNLKSGTYTINISGITSIDGIKSEVQGFSYEHKREPGLNELIITEILADPDPEVELPNAEFIEILNKTDETLYFKNAIISINSSTAKIPDAQILPKQYLILTNQNNTAPYEKLGVTLGISSLPALTNSEGKIILRNSQGEAVHSLSYTSNWYGSESKGDGGWSLEMADTSNLSEMAENWKPSVDKSGGTPGRKNSVAGNVIDNILPIITGIFPISENQLEISFSENMQIVAVQNPENYAASNLGKPQTVSYLWPDENKAVLNFSKPFEKGMSYELTISKLKDLAGNEPLKAVYMFGLPQEILPNDLVINEILFNPLSYCADYIEIYNRSAKIINPEKLRLANKNEAGRYEEAAQLPRLLILPGDYLVLTTDPENVKSHYTVPHPQNLVKFSALPSFDDKLGKVALLTKSLEVIDYIKYSEAFHYELLSIKDGVALERLTTEKPAVDRNNWFSASETCGFGTPTGKNSHTSENPSTDKTISLRETSFSPDNDGYQDLLSIDYQSEQAGFTATIKIYDLKGRFVKQIANNELLQDSGTFTWDGIDENGRIAETGVYIVYAEVFNTSGEVKQFKLACVKAEKK